MRNTLGIDKSIDILDYVHSLSQNEQQEAHLKLQQIERKAMVDMIPQPGIHELMDYLANLNMNKAICTRNFPIPVNYLLQHHLPGVAFGPVITREFKPPKPNPEGILHITREWGVDPKDCIMVGDSIDDMTAGYRAGNGTILLQSDVNKHLNEIEQTDRVVTSLEQIISILENGLEVKQKPV